MTTQHTAPNGITYTIHSAKVVLRHDGAEVYLWHDGKADADLEGQLDLGGFRRETADLFREATQHVSAHLRSAA